MTAVPDSPAPTPVHGARAAGGRETVGVGRPAADPRLWLGSAAALALLGVLVLRLWIKYVGALPGDRWAATHATWQVLGEPWRDLGTLFSVIGTPPVAVLTVLVASWFVGRSGGLPALAFLAISTTGVLFNAGLKELSGPTPLVVERWGANASGALNYPSGHTVYAVVVFGALAWLAWAHRRRDIAAVLVGLILAMGPFRVIAETHFVSDVIAGYLVGIGWLLVAALLTGAGGTARGLWLGSRSSPL